MTGFAIHPTTSPHQPPTGDEQVLPQANVGWALLTLDLHPTLWLLFGPHCVRGMTRRNMIGRDAQVA